MNAPVAALLIILLVVTVVLSLCWVARDAHRRGRSPGVILFLCLATWPIGFLIWREIRPPMPIGPPA